ncbi:hypothetical protein LZ32DRAFT_597789 [Colletotrichum eremochloae]|nr:hypothetical protein LZ32DRAFT_597789 [Colletotrichum eremochloae]
MGAQAPTATSGCYSFSVARLAATLVRNRTSRPQMPPTRKRCNGARHPKATQARSHGTRRAVQRFRPSRSGAAHGSSQTTHTAPSLTQTYALSGERGIEHRPKWVAILGMFATEQDRDPAGMATRRELWVTPDMQPILLCDSVMVHAGLVQQGTGKINEFYPVPKWLVRSAPSGLDAPRLGWWSRALLGAANKGLTATAHRASYPPSSVLLDHLRIARGVAA